MASRKVILAEGETYHILNRGVGKRKIFADARNYKRFIQTAEYYQLQDLPTKFSKFILNKDKYEIENEEKNVEIFAYCLMPTHFHFILRQTAENGISIFIKKLLDSYVRYFNTRHSRKGPLFQGNFKAIRVESEEQLVHLSRYIHLNPITDFLVKDLKNYPYSSYLEYINLSKTQIVNKEPVFHLFQNSKAYESFVLSRKEYQRKLKEIERILLE